jgi:hypothetical protein
VKEADDGEEEEEEWSGGEKLVEIESGGVDANTERGVYAPFWRRLLVRELRRGSLWRK